MFREHIRFNVLVNVFFSSLSLIYCKLIIHYAHNQNLFCILYIIIKWKHRNCIWNVQQLSLTLRPTAALVLKPIIDPTE